MGTAVHSVIELLSKAQLEGEIPAKGRALELLDSCWSSQPILPGPMNSRTGPKSRSDAGYLAGMAVSKSNTSLR